MKYFEKGIIGLMAAIMLVGAASIATSGSITANGMSQGDQVTFYGNVVTMSNEQKADYNKLFADYSALKVLANSNKAKYNTLAQNYSSIMVKFNTWTSFVQFNANTFTPSSGSSVTAADGAITGSRTATTDLTLTGL